MKILCLFGRHAYGDPARGEGYENANFLPALGALGHEVAVFDTFSRSDYRDFADLNHRLVETINASRPDLLFCVLMNYEVWTETLDLVRGTTPVAVLNWGTDDSWKFTQVSRFLTAHVDLHVTTDRSTAERSHQIGLMNVARSQWGVPTARLADPVGSADCRYDVSFVGAAYGDRPHWIDALRRDGVDVACFGHGWPNGPAATEEVTRIYRSSRLSLNFADSGHQIRGGRVVRSRQIKARTFEVPGVGGCLLTQWADGLDTCFEPGREIAVFDDEVTLLAAVRRYLNNPSERDAMAKAGNARVRCQHTYEERMPELLVAARKAAAARGIDGWRCDPAMLAPALARYRSGPLLRFLRSMFVAAGTAIAGKERATRTARRLAFELSWRLFGARTYGASGLPGRMFYRES